MGEKDRPNYSNELIFSCLIGCLLEKGDLVVLAGLKIILTL